MAPTPDMWQEELELVLQSAAFARARQAKLLLSWLVAQVVEGSSHLLNEYDVALHLFRRADHDPASDAHIRKQMSRLRWRLTSYYDGEGQSRPFEIRIHGFQPQLVATSKKDTASSGGIVLLRPFQSGDADLGVVAARLADELAHLLWSQRKVQLAPNARTSQTHLVLSGSVWRTEASPGFLVFARTANAEGVVLRSLRFTHAAHTPMETCAQAILDGLFPTPG